MAASPKKTGRKIGQLGVARTTPLGATLTALRVRAGMTAMALAAATGLSHSTIGAAETGRRCLRVASLDAISAALGCDPTVLRAAHQASKHAADKLHVLRPYTTAHDVAAAVLVDRWEYLTPDKLRQITEIAS